ncbi:MAG: Nif3-like dinuclear metal center hexameric protein [Planctomycetales bacterium]
MPSIADLISFLKTFAAADLAEEWDNVGLLLGDRGGSVSRVLTCLTLTEGVAQEAIAERVELVVTHHPVLFRPVKRLTADDPQGKMLWDLARAGIAVYSPHTGYDNAANGINQQLARLLDLTDVAPLRPTFAPPQCKVVCFVPRDALAAVQEAMWSQGAGVIGEYSKCSFVLDGTGSFWGSSSSQPTVGASGRLEQVTEARLEVVCPADKVAAVLDHLRKVHPYEEPAYDVYPLQSGPSARGAGRVGTLPIAATEPGNRRMALSELLSKIRDRLPAPGLQYVGDPAREVSRVGICCGSGGELLDAAAAGGCDVFLTGEARFHTCLEAQSLGIALILAGHYATERPAMEYLAGVLAEKFTEIAVWASRSERDPIQCGW